MAGIIINPWNKESSKNLKTISEIDSGIDAILKMDNLNSLSYEEINALYFKLFGLFPLITMPFRKEFHKDFKFYRVRELREGQNADISNIKTFDAPSLEDYNNLGRANWKGRNVFYGSQNPYTALKEVKETSVGKDFYISKWGINWNIQSLDKMPIVTLIYENIPKENIWSALNESQATSLEKLKEVFGIEGYEKYIHLIKRINNLFVVNDSSKYPITAFIADKTIYSDKNTSTEIFFPILIYPSVETERKHCNYAIHPDFVKQYMHLEQVIHVELTDIDRDYFKIKLNKVGTRNEKGRIDWYSMSLDKTNAYHGINSLSCFSCKKQFDLKDLDEFVFKRKGVEISHGEIVAEFIYKRNYDDFYDLKGMWEGDGAIGGMEATFKDVFLPDITVTIQNETHSNLMMDFRVLLPYKYEKC